MPTGRLRSTPTHNHAHHHHPVWSCLVLSHHDLLISRHVMAQPQQPGGQTHHHLEDAASQAGVQVGRHRALRLPDVTIYSLPLLPLSRSALTVCRHDLKARSDEYRHWQKDFLPKKQAVMIGRYVVYGPILSILYSLCRCRYGILCGGSIYSEGVRE